MGVFISSGFVLKCFLQFFFFCKRFFLQAIKSATARAARAPLGIMEALETPEQHHNIVPWVLVKGGGPYSGPNYAERPDPLRQQRTRIPARWKLIREHREIFSKSY